MAELSIRISIGPNALQHLIDGGMHLCLTRGVNDGGEDREGNVVFAAVPPKNLAHSVAFAWAERYQVFETFSYGVGVKVVPETQLVDLDMGNKATFDETGMGSLGPGQPQRLQVLNLWKSGAHLGVSTVDPATSESYPFFLSKVKMLEFTSTLTPMNRFGIFWNGVDVYNTMIDETSPNIYRFEIPTGQTSVALMYDDDGKWSLA